MLTTHAVGIDLGTTYSCIAYLNEQGEPVSIPNKEGEISTPSVVLFDQGETIVGTEALRNTILHPRQVVQNVKRFMGDSRKTWEIDGQTYSPVDISAAIVRKLVGDAQQQIGPIERGVITVPAQFSEAQRLATVEAGKRAGLTHVEIINEPVAAALCYVLGTEGLWFSELANEQRILVYDLGGGTFDLSLVSYKKDQVRVIASAGDLHLGGIDWNQCLLSVVADQFAREFGDDPRADPESLQYLAWEVEQCKRSLTVRPKAALIVQHAGRRKTYQIERDQFNHLTQHLLQRTSEITCRLIDQHKRGATHLDLTVLSTGGSSRMPMVDEMLRGLKGTTISKALSPDQSIAHGATYYAGMLLTNSEFVPSIIDADAVGRLSRMKQQSVNARGLGILIRDMETNTRVPYFLIPANSPLPAAATKKFGTVSPNQRRVSLIIVESGDGPGLPPTKLGTCTIAGLPPQLPAESLIAVTISYDESARVQVLARDVASGKEAHAEIHRGENVVPGSAPAEHNIPDDEEVMTLLPVDESGAFSIPCCGKCGSVLNVRGECHACLRQNAANSPAVKPVVVNPAAPVAPPVVRPIPKSIKPVPRSVAPAPRPPEPQEISELPKKQTPISARQQRPAKPARPGGTDPGEEEFWKFINK